MTWPWALLLLFLLCFPYVGVKADPAIARPGPTEGLAQWTLSNLSNYTLVDVTVDSRGASLGWIRGVTSDTTQADFSLAPTKVNIDLTGSPGDVAILNTSQQGPVQSLTFQPGPAQMDDNYLYLNKQNLNFGTDPTLFVGNWGGTEWTRSILHFQNFPLPGNATLRTAHLQLYMHAADTAGPMDISVHRIVTSWTEGGSTWNTRDGVVAWNASGGDYSPTAVDTVAGITTTLGWYTWNVTSLAQAWRSGSIPNQGIMVREADDLVNSAGRKQFYSSDATNASLRPRLLLTYTTPSSTGVLESRLVDTFNVSTWQALWWNSTIPAGTSLNVQTRSGNVPVVDPSWSPWSSGYPSPGSPISSPPARYLQYRARLFTPSSTSPILHDVSAGWGHYSPTGSIITQPLLPDNLTQWGRVEANWSGTAGTDVAIAYSQDNGSSWAPATSGQNLTAALATRIVLRLSLNTGNTTQSPRVAGFSLGFLLTTSGGGGGGNPPGGGLPWWLLLVPIAFFIAWAMARPLLRGPLKATDLFLIHADGRLVLHVGGKENPLKDELAVSGMFTLVAQFVKDSFGRAGGGGGELKSLRVDEREVTIAKGDYLFLALVAEGQRPPGLEATMVAFLRDLEASHRATLEQWDGLASGLGDLETELKRFLERGYRRAHRGPHETSRVDKRQESLKNPPLNGLGDATDDRGGPGPAGPDPEDLPGGGPRGR